MTEKKGILSPEYQYQTGFSSQHTELYLTSPREQKAKKIISVILDYLGDRAKECNLLDVGSSTGIMTRYYSQHFKTVTGIDIDEKAVAFATENFKSENLKFQLGDSMKIDFPANHFDVVTCTQVYEHVPDSTQLLSEIHRVLKPGGICYFAAGNRLVLIEGHYKLPFLSVVPKFMAHLYLKFLKRGTYYYENHLTYWQLKRLVSKFEIIDYTKKIIADPKRFSLEDTLPPGSLKHRLAKALMNVLYFFSTDYIWILKKN